MNEHSSVPRRGPKAGARRERLLAEFKRSGLSAYAFSKRHAVAYSTLIQWLKDSGRLPGIRLSPVLALTSLKARGHGNKWQQEMNGSLRELAFAGFRAPVVSR